MTTLNGYSFDETEWSTRGGSGQCLIATKGGKKFFMKRLSRPKYPVSSYTGEFRFQRIAECDRWLRTRKAIVSAIPGEGTGNIVKPIEYFRDGAIFYEVAHYIPVDQIPYSELYKLPAKDRACVMMTAASSLKELHAAGVVHGDLDPNNILISRSAKDMLVTKLIDFTDAFFEKDPPKSIVSKEAWWSPEVALYSKAYGKDPNPYKRYVSCKADVFSLGLIFHQYCTKGGQFPKHQGDYPWQGFAGGGQLMIDPGIEPCFRELIEQMLQPEPSDRPSMEEVHRICQGIWRSGGISKTREQERPAPSPKPGLSVQAVEKDEIKPRPAALRPASSPRPTEKAVSGFKPGSGKIGGSSVVDVRSINERKVELVLSNGTTQICDVRFALAAGYISR